MPFAPQRLRQIAVDHVEGEVIGGARLSRYDGLYYVRIPDDGTAGPLMRSIERLVALPWVEYASPDHIYTADALDQAAPAPEE